MFGRWTGSEAISDEDLSAAAKEAFAYNCSIPDDHIDPRRWALFVARWVLGDSRKEKRHARTTA